MEKLKIQIPLLLKHLRHSPQLFIDGNVNEVKTYLIFFQGLFLAYKLIDLTDFEREISAWYQDYVKVKSPKLYWFYQFEIENEDKSESEKITTLLDNLESFFDSYFKEN